MTRTLYVGDYDRSSWSLRPWLALTVGGVPFETVVIPLDQPSTRGAIGAVSPTAKVPALHADGEVIWESLAICEYAAELSPSLWPTDAASRAVARSVATEMHGGFPNLRAQHPMHLLARTPTRPTPEVRGELARFDEILAFCRRRSPDGGFLFGAFSVADAMYAPVATRIRTYDLPVGPEARAWVDTLFGHPAVREWERRARMARG